jgi:hypothetical protein
MRPENQVQIVPEQIVPVLLPFTSIIRKNLIITFYIYSQQKTFAFNLKSQL